VLGQPTPGADDRNSPIIAGGCDVDACATGDGFRGEVVERPGRVGGVVRGDRRGLNAAGIAEPEVQGRTALRMFGDEAEPPQLFVEPTARDQKASLIQGVGFPGHS